MAEKLKSFVVRWKYEAVIFLMTMIPVLFNYGKLAEIHRMYVPYYLFDFSMGINSRVLVGSLVKLLTSHPTEEWITGFATVILIFGMLLTAFALGGVVKNSKSENKFAVFVFIVFFVSGAYTISLFSRFFGMLDIHMYILALISVVFAQNKYLRWLVPVLCVSGVLVNYVFIMSYFPFVLLAMLYYADKSEKKLGDITVIVITLISVLALTLYCVFVAKDHMFMTFEEALKIMEEKIGHTLTDEQNEYASLYLFGFHTESEEIYGVKIADASPIEYLYYFIRFLYENRIGMSGIITLSIITVPVVAAFWTIWIMCIKNAEKKSRKFVYLCCILSVICIPVCCILSTDFIRWIGSGVICQFGMCFLLFYTKDVAFDKTIEKLRKLFSENKIILIIIFFVYISSAYLELAT
ncbi:MAG: hypothetical protein IJZ07_02365 [Clostridia bacterium]|nr:hypothetical protein [Clostridia bacterium]